MQARAVSFHTLTIPEDTPVVLDTNQDVFLVKPVTIHGSYAEDRPDVEGHEVTIITVLREALVRNPETGDLEVGGA